MTDIDNRNVISSDVWPFIVQSSAPKLFVLNGANLDQDKVFEPSFLYVVVVPAQILERDKEIEAAKYKKLRKNLTVRVIDYGEVGDLPQRIVRAFKDLCKLLQEHRNRLTLIYSIIHKMQTQPHNTPERILSEIAGFTLAPSPPRIEVAVIGYRDKDDKGFIEDLPPVEWTVPELTRIKFICNQLNQKYSSIHFTVLNSKADISKQAFHLFVTRASTNEHCFGPYLAFFNQGAKTTLDESKDDYKKYDGYEGDFFRVDVDPTTFLNIDETSFLQYVLTAFDYFKFNTSKMRRIPDADQNKPIEDLLDKFKKTKSFIPL